MPNIKEVPIHKWSSPDSEALYALASALAAIATGILVALLIWWSTIWPGGKVAFSDLVDHFVFVHPIYIGLTMLLVSLLILLQGADLIDEYMRLAAPLISFTAHVFCIGTGVTIVCLMKDMLAPGELHSSIPRSLYGFLICMFLVGGTLGHVGLGIAKSRELRRLETEGKDDIDPKEARSSAKASKAQQLFFFIFACAVLSCVQEPLHSAMPAKDFYMLKWCELATQWTHGSIDDRCAKPIFQ